MKKRGGIEWKLRDDRKKIHIYYYIEICLENEGNRKMTKNIVPLFFIK